MTVRKYVPPQMRQRVREVNRSIREAPRLWLESFRALRDRIAEQQATTSKAGKPWEPFDDA